MRWQSIDECLVSLSAYCLHRICWTILISFRQDFLCQIPKWSQIPSRSPTDSSSKYANHKTSSQVSQQHFNDLKISHEILPWTCARHPVAVIVVGFVVVHSSRRISIYFRLYLVTSQFCAIILSSGAAFTLANNTINERTGKKRLWTLKIWLSGYQIEQFHTCFFPLKLLLNKKTNSLTKEFHHIL